MLLENIRRAQHARSEYSAYLAKVRIDQIFDLKVEVTVRLCLKN